MEINCDIYRDCNFCEIVPAVYLCDACKKKIGCEECMTKYRDDYICPDCEADQGKDEKK